MAAAINQLCFCLISLNLLGGVDCNYCLVKLKFFEEQCRTQSAKEHRQEYIQCIGEAKNVLKNCLPCICNILSEYADINCLF